MMKRTDKKFFAALLVCLAAGMLAAPALALSDEEHRQMMEDPEHGEQLAEAEKYLNEAWAKAQKSLPKVVLEALKKDQSAWLTEGRDEEAKAKKIDWDDWPYAYADVTMERAKLLSELAERYVGNEMTEIRLVNETDETILVAVARDAFTDVIYGNDADRVDVVYGKIFDVSKGWYALEPGETKRIQPFTWLDYCAYYFYAVTESGGRSWGGHGEDGKFFWIRRGEPFEAGHPDLDMPGGEQVCFQKFTSEHWKYWSGKNGLEARELAVKFKKDTDDTD